PPEPTAVEAAKKLLSAQYEGPEGLDEDEVGRLRSETDQLGAFLNTLSQKRGLTEYVLGSNPGLTRGQARFEAQSLNKSPEFFDDVRGQAREARTLDRRIGQETEAARSFAEQRAEEER